MTPSQTTAPPGAAQRLTLPRWTVWGLLASWVAYWLLIVTAVAAKAGWAMLIAYLHTTTGTFTLNYTGTGIGPALVIVGPPLLLAALWLATRPRQRE